MSSGGHDLSVRRVVATWRFLCSSFLVMTCFLIGDYNILPKRELHRSLQAVTYSLAHRTPLTAS